MAKKTTLSLVGPDATGFQPPFNLGPHGRSLWDRIQAEYDVSDSGGIELLAQACAGADLAARLQEEIDRDGTVLRSRGSVRTNPAVKDLLGTRAFIVRTVSRLGLNYEPLRTSGGRPPES